MGWEDPANGIAAAERAGLAAIRADSNDPWAHLATAAARLRAESFEDALASFEAALRLNPSFALAHGLYGLVLSSVGRWEEGAAAARNALHLSPRDPFSAVYSAIAAYAEFAGRNYDEAIRLAREGIHQRPDFPGGYRALTAAAAMAGDMELAKTSLEALRRVRPGISLAWVAGQMLVREKPDRAHYLEAFRRAGLD
jgi:tetratricopeptide (TPR) repeat protein